MKAYVLALLFLITPLTSMALPQPIRAGDVARGGQAKEEFALLAIESKPLAGKNIGEEILSLSYGDEYGKVVKGEPGYFQVSVDRGGRRVVIDLSQITKTGIEPSELRKILAKSKFVASSDMTMDPHDRSMNITLNMKEPVEVAVQTETQSRAKIVLTLRSPKK